MDDDGAVEDRASAGPLVSVIIATVNRLDLVSRCLTSVFLSDYRPIEVIVVDNGSTEDIATQLWRLFPTVRVIRNTSNKGFAGGYNRGLREAHGEFVAVLNNDAVVSKEWLGSMVRVAEKDVSIGSVGSVILDGNCEGTVDSCGVGIALDGMSRQALRGEQAPTLIKPKEVLLVSGCACLFRREALADVGLFDESFFAYCEDTDLGLRLRWAGWKAVIAPYSTVVHHYSLTGGKFSLNKAFLVERNHYWVVVKNFPYVLFPLVVLTTLWRYLFQCYALITGADQLREFTSNAPLITILATLLRAHVEALAGLPAMLRRRAGSSKKRRISNWKMCRHILSCRISIRHVVLGRSDAGNR